MRRLLKTLSGERGELYGTVTGRRLLLAQCAPRIEIMEHSVQVPILNANSYPVKRTYIVLALCEDMELTRSIDMDFLKTVSAYDLSTDIQRQDGVFENILFANITPQEINLDGEWIFDVSGQKELVKKLLSM